MPKTAKTAREAEVSKAKKRISELDKQIDQRLTRLQEIREGCLCFPFLGVDITGSIVDDVFEELRTKFRECNGRLNVIVED
jgi:hypothetical protein